LQAFEQSREIRERLVGENLASVGLQVPLAQSYEKIADFNGPTEAMRAYQRAVAICERLVVKHPKNAD